MKHANFIFLVFSSVLCAVNVLRSHLALSAFRRSAGAVVQKKSRGQAVCLKSGIKKEVRAAWVYCQVCVQFVFLDTAQMLQRLQREGHLTSELKCHRR